MLGLTKILYELPASDIPDTSPQGEDLKMLVVESFAAVAAMVR